MLITAIPIVPAALVAVTALGDALAQRLKLPASILLVLTGAILSFLPILPAVTIDPQVILLLFLPPLIYASGVGMSWRGFRKNLRPILLLAVGCVLFTAGAVAAAGHLVLGMPIAVAFLLGAVVSPPDPVAPMAIARSLQTPKRLLTILEGEGLANDATALILVSFAIAAVESGRFSLVAATEQFTLIVVGELLLGATIGWATLRIRAWIGNPQVEITLSLLTPFIAFWPPHAVGGSGVLAALAAGLWVSWNGPKSITPATRLQGYFVWGLLSHTLEGILFLLIGLQVHTILAGLRGTGLQHALAAAGIVVTVVVLVRFLWVFAVSYLPRLIPFVRYNAAPDWRSDFFVAFTGIRGSVSIVAAFSIPLTIAAKPFPDRNLILFVALSVVVFTLVAQGILLERVLHHLGLSNEGRIEREASTGREVAARIIAIEAVLGELDRLAAHGAAPQRVSPLRKRHQDRLAEYRGTADPRIAGSPVADDAQIELHLVAAERRCIGELYLASEIGDEARRRIERELDLEDARNRHAAESATGDPLDDPQVEEQRT